MLKTFSAYENSKLDMWGTDEPIDGGGDQLHT